MRRVPAGFVASDLGGAGEKEKDFVESTPYFKGMG
jgi:hypothetical protein